MSDYSVLSCIENMKKLENMEKILDELIVMNNKLDLIQEIINDLHEINQKLDKECE